MVGTDLGHASSVPSGEAKIRLACDGPTGEVHLTCAASWWDGEGNLSEASLSVTGLTTELYDLLQECTTWVHRRWRRPVTRAMEQPGPFDDGA